jgi:hypothetical protein
MIFEIPEGYNIISEEEHADMVRESAELDVKWASAGVLTDIHAEGALVDCN